MRAHTNTILCVNIVGLHEREQPREKWRRRVESAHVLRHWELAPLVLPYHQQQRRGYIRLPQRFERREGFDGGLVFSPIAPGTTVVKEAVGIAAGQVGDLLSPRDVLRTCDRRHVVGVQHGQLACELGHRDGVDVFDRHTEGSVVALNSEEPRRVREVVALGRRIGVEVCTAFGVEASAVVRLAGTGDVHVVELVADLACEGARERTDNRESGAAHHRLPLSLA